MVFNYLTKLFVLQIEDLSQQAQVAAAEKFKEPPVIPATEAGGSTTVRYCIWLLYKTLTQHFIFDTNFIF